MGYLRGTLVERWGNSVALRLNRWRAAVSAGRVGREWRTATQRLSGTRAGRRWQALPENARRAVLAIGLVALLFGSAGIALGISASRPGAPAAASTEAGTATPTGLPTSTYPSVPGSATDTPWAYPSPSWSPTLPAPTPRLAQFAAMPSVEPVDPAVLATFSCQPYANEVSASGGRLYVYCMTGEATSGQDEVVAIDLATNELARTYLFKLPNPAPTNCAGGCVWDDSRDLVVDHGLWVGGGDSGMERLDLSSGKAGLVHKNWLFLGHGAGKLWVAPPIDLSNGDGWIDAVDPKNGAYAEGGIHVDTGGRENVTPIFPGVLTCSSMAFAWFPYSTFGDFDLMYPATYSIAGDRPIWPLHLGQIDDVGQADGACWASLVLGDGEYLVRLTTNGADLETTVLPASIRFMDGKAWLVKSPTPGTTVLQQLDLKNFQAVGAPVRVGGDIVGMAGGSIWTTDQHGYLIRVGLTAAPPASPSPSLTPTPAPSPSGTPAPSPSGTPTPEPTPSPDSTDGPTASPVAEPSS